MIFICFIDQIYHALNKWFYTRNRWSDVIVCRFYFHFYIDNKSKKLISLLTCCNKNSWKIANDAFVVQQKMRIQANKGSIELSPPSSPTVFVHKHKNHCWLCSRGKCVDDKKYRVAKSTSSNLKCLFVWVCVYVMALRVAACVFHDNQIDLTTMILL